MPKCYLIILFGKACLRCDALQEELTKVIFGEKYTVVVRRDMEEACIQPQLWLQQVANG
jgi:hypothetical protein